MHRSIGDLLKEPPAAGDFYKVPAREWSSVSPLGKTIASGWTIKQKQNTSISAYESLNQVKNLVHKIKDFLMLSLYQTMGSMYSWSHASL
jgi:hypothetical protein